MTSAIEVRPARSADRARMLEITRDVWDGSDYFPVVWDRWLTSPAGILLAAEVDGVVVGLQHVDKQTDATAWLEGIRVAEDARGRGIGQELLRAGLEWARAHGCPRARLSTSNLNIASNRIAKNARMQPIATFVPYARILDVGPVEPAHVRVAPAIAGDEIFRFLETRMGGDGQLYTEEWTAYTLTISRLALLLAMASVVVFGNDKIEAVAIATSGTGGTLKLGLLTGSHEGMSAIATYLASAAHRCGVATLRAMVTSKSILPLEQAGYVRNGEHAMHVYETLLYDSASSLRE